MNRFFFDNSFKFRLFRHTVFFLITVSAFTAILFVQNYAENFIEIFWVTFSNAFFFFSYAYITIFLLIPEFLLTKKTGWFVNCGDGNKWIGRICGKELFFA